jgi:hypothetical protein
MRHQPCRIAFLDKSSQPCFYFPLPTSTPNQEWQTAKHVHVHQHPIEKDAEADHHEDAMIAIAHDEEAAAEASDGKRSEETTMSAMTERRG